MHFSQSSNLDLTFLLLRLFGQLAVTLSRSRRCCSRTPSATLRAIAVTKSVAQHPREPFNGEFSELLRWNFQGATVVDCTDLMDII